MSHNDAAWKTARVKSVQKILIVDDNPDIIEIFTEMLQSHAFTVFQATNGKEALKVLKENLDMDLVLTDMVMPEMEGVELIRTIRAQYKNIKVIACSGGNLENSKNYLEVANHLGAHEVLCKPIEEMSLLKAISSVNNR